MEPEGDQDNDVDSSAEDRELTFLYTEYRTLRDEVLARSRVRFEILTVLIAGSTLILSTQSWTDAVGDSKPTEGAEPVWTVARSAPTQWRTRDASADDR